MEHIEIVVGPLCWFLEEGIGTLLQENEVMIQRHCLDCPR
jgi:hypothetical protein